MRYFENALVFLFLFSASICAKSQAVLDNDSIVNKSDEFLRQFDYDSALFYLDMAASEQRDDLTQIAITLKKVNIFRSKEALNIADEHLKSASELYKNKALNDPEILGLINYHQANSEMSKGNWLDATKFSEEAIKNFKLLDDASNLPLAKALIQSGNSLVRQRDGKGSKEKLIEGLELLGDVNKNNAEYFLLGHFGMHEYYYYNYLDSAAESHLKLGLSKTNGLIHPKSKVLGGFYGRLGQFNRLKREYGSAKTFYENVLTIWQFHYGEIHPSIASVYNSLGLLAHEQGDYPEAVIYLNRSLNLNKKIYGPNHNAVARTLTNLGNSYKWQGKYDQAITTQNEALRIRKKLFGEYSSQYASSLNNLALVYERIPDYEKAIALLKKVKKIWAKISPENNGRQAFIETNIASAYYHKTDYDNVITHLAKALTFYLPDFKASDLYENPTLDEIPMDISFHKTLDLKAITLLEKYFRDNNRNDLKAALATCELVIAFIERISRSFTSDFSKRAYIEAIYQSYETAISACYELAKLTKNYDYTEKAFEFLEKSKALVLIENMRSEDVSKQAGLPNQIVHQEDSLKLKIAALKYAIFKAGQLSKDQSAESLATLTFDHAKTIIAFEDLKKSIKTDYSKYYSLKYDNQSVELENISEQLLTGNDLLIEYFMGPDDIFIFFIDKEKIHIEKRSSSFWLEEKIFEFRNIINQKSSDIKAFKTLSNQLYDSLFWSQIGLTAYDKLIIIPDGVLNYMPFGILLKDSQGENFNDLSYLIKDHQIAYQYSANVWFENNKKRSDDKKLNLIAFAPDFNTNSGDQINKSDQPFLASKDVVRGNLAPLAGTIQEIESLNELIKGESFKGIFASENEFKANAGNFGIIHLATHAIIDDENPMQSRLIFTADSLQNDEDGDLYSWELYNMKLNAKLAVLSACNTGFGKIHSGEGVMSLGRAFAYAGCPSVIMSLWPAQDDATANIMTFFYQGLANNNYKDEALRAAKLKYLGEAQDYMAHPFYWAGFVAQGDPRPIQFDKPFAVNWLYVIVGLIFIAGIVIYFFRFR